MKTTLLISLTLFVLGCKEKHATPEITKNNPELVFEQDGITINTPKTEGNLSIFMLTGKEKINGIPYKTLSEIMKTKQVVVRETGQVNTLSVDNNSDAYVFIHSGDIVKGGKQDRTISYDIILPPKTKNTPLESFCVEQDRWQQRDNENVNAFSSNTKMLSSRTLKLAAKHGKSQTKVWHEVSEQKAVLNKKLSEKNGYTVNVAANASHSSLQLALESKELKKSKDSIYLKLKDLIKTPDAIGYAYSINGEIYGVDVYNNRQLFIDLWDKILESIIVEAISKEGDTTATATTKKDVMAYIEAVKINAKTTDKTLNTATNFKTTKATKGHVKFSTEDLKQRKWVHKSYMKTDPKDSLKTKNTSESFSLHTMN